VQGGAEANIHDTTLVTASGDIVVRADEEAILDAATETDLLATIKAAKEKAFGLSSVSSGTLALGASGIVATNAVQSDASATVMNSSLTTQDLAAGRGNVSVEASNNVKLDALALNTIRTEIAVLASPPPMAASGAGTRNDVIGVTLAFNSIGWQPQKTLFNTIDTILGDPAMSGAYGGQTNSDATAAVVDTLITATGEVKVSSLAMADLTSLVENFTLADSLGRTGTQGVSLGAVVASNKVASAAHASIDYADTFTHRTTPVGAADIQADDQVTVSAEDQATIDATVHLKALVETIALPGGMPGQVTKSTTVAGVVTMNDVRGGASAQVDDAVIRAGGTGVSVTADETATITSTIDTESKAAGLQFGNSTSLGIGIIIATNLVQSLADATIHESNVRTVGTGSVIVDASNTASITAPLSNKVTAEQMIPVTAANDIAITLAFNTIGWQPNNILHNTVDTLLGDPLIANALGGQVPSGASASMEDTLVQTAGAVSVTASSAAEISATNTNLTDSTSLGLPGGQVYQGARSLSLYS
jgi:hypothetical protein